MHPPLVDLIHLKTSRHQEAGLLIDRYWFQWFNRRKGGELVLRLTLLDEAGNAIRESVISLPQVKVRGYMPPIDTRPHQLLYDADVRLQLDVPVGESLPVCFSYCTVGRRPSQTVRGVLKGKIEPLIPTR